MRVLLADDHTLFRAGVRALLGSIDDVTIVGEAGDGHAALEMIDRVRPDVALVDITMPGLNGLEVASRVAKASPGTRIVILSMHVGEAYVAQALKAGVAGYLLKDAAANELEMALRAVARGETYLSPAISKHVVEGFLGRGQEPGDPLAGLTPRQREILQLVAEGKTTRAIAETLGVSIKTVEAHRAQLMERVGIHDVPGLVRLAIRAGLVSPEG